MALARQTIVGTHRLFNAPGLNETLPGGACVLETEEYAPHDRLDPATWIASAFVILHTRPPNPGLTRVLAVTIDDLDCARARERAPYKALSDALFEDLLNDRPMFLKLPTDNVTEAQLRDLYSGSWVSWNGNDEPDPTTGATISRTTCLSEPKRMKA